MANSTTLPIRARTIDEIIASRTGGRTYSQITDRAERMRLYRSAQATQKYEQRCLALKQENQKNTGGPHVNG
jgi:hypothetical protein